MKVALAGTLGGFNAYVDAMPRVAKLLHHAERLELGWLMEEPCMVRAREEVNLWKANKGELQDLRAAYRKGAWSFTWAWMQALDRRALSADHEAMVSQWMCQLPGTGAILAEQLQESGQKPAKAKVQQKADRISAILSRLNAGTIETMLLTPSSKASKTGFAVATDLKDPAVFQSFYQAAIRCLGGPVTSKPDGAEDKEEETGARDATAGGMDERAGGNDEDFAGKEETSATKEERSEAQERHDETSNIVLSVPPQFWEAVSAMSQAHFERSMGVPPSAELDVLWHHALQAVAIWDKLGHTPQAISTSPVSKRSPKNRKAEKDGRAGNAENSVQQSPERSASSGDEHQRRREWRCLGELVENMLKAVVARCEAAATRFELEQAETPEYLAAMNGMDLPTQLASMIVDTCTGGRVGRVVRKLQASATKLKMALLTGSRGKMKRMKDTVDSVQKAHDMKAETVQAAKDALADREKLRPSQEWLELAASVENEHLSIVEEQLAAEREALAGFNGWTKTFEQALIQERENGWDLQREALGEACTALEESPALFRPMGQDERDQAAMEALDEFLQKSADTRAATGEEEKSVAANAE